MIKEYFRDRVCSLNFVQGYYKFKKKYRRTKSAPSHYHTCMVILLLKDQVIV